MKTRGVLVALFATYLALLIWAVLWKLEVPYVGAAWSLPRPFKLVPFLASGDAGASDPLELLANVLLFVPFGVYLGLLAPRWRWWTAAVVFAGASLLLEITQHGISTGSFDITDVIVNTAGGVAGLGLLSLIRPRLAVTTITRILLVGTVLAVIAVVVFAVSPLQYHQPRDVIFPSPTRSL